MIRHRAGSRKMEVYGGTRLLGLPQIGSLPSGLRHEIRVVSEVLPFKLNDYVVEELIDWSRVPDDPIFRLTFPHREMLEREDFDTVSRIVDRGGAGGGRSEIRAVADRIRRKLNPHPAAQLEKNVPMFRGRKAIGLQHKYRETVLFFPSQGQTCHAYCAYCFRWAQFVGMKGLKQASGEPELLGRYLRAHPMVTDVLLTGGDPLIMSARNLSRYLDVLLSDELRHVRNVRIGTKALSFWPYRFLTDADAGDLLRLFERCARRGRHLALMAHISHPRELETEAVEGAIRRIRGTGAVIRTQAPLVRRVNDDARVWGAMWRRQVALGCVPYYLFVERDTGARSYFELPLERAYRIYRDALASCSGLSRTARGPSMSATPGKVVVDGVATVRGERVFCLRFLQARNPRWVGVPFFARYDPRATWFDQLRPAFGERSFFFEEDPIAGFRGLGVSGNGNGRGAPAEERGGGGGARTPGEPVPQFAPRPAAYEELR